MASFLTKTFASFFNRILQLGKATNDGIDGTTYTIESGDGAKSAIGISDDQFIVKPQNDNTTSTLVVQNKDANNIFTVDTSSSLVKAGSSQSNVLTLNKEMGLYDFSPGTAGYHYPLIANNMFYVASSETFNSDNDWGNGTDPATTLDVSELTETENAIAIYWLLDDNIALDSVRYMARCDNSSTDTLDFHLLSYAMDTSTNHGDLSCGTVHASGQEAAAVNTTVRTGTLTLDSEDIDSGRVVIGFVESTSTADVSVSFSIKYHIR